MSDGEHRLSRRALPDPPESPESTAFVAAAREGRFLLRRCIACGKAHWYPRARCPFCFGETAWEEASGRGTVYSYTVLAREAPPRSLAYVALEEGRSCSRASSRAMQVPWQSDRP